MLSTKTKAKIKTNGKSIFTFDKKPGISNVQIKPLLTLFKL
jgi:hypothetical protein